MLDNGQLGAYVVASDARSRDLYARHSFEVLDQVLELPSADGPAHVMYPMWRWPAATAAEPRARTQSDVIQTASGPPAPQHLLTPPFTPEF